jgi:hypothetical protein
MDALIPRLLQRQVWIEEVLEGLSLGADSGVLLILGPMCAGKSLLARDLARGLQAQGQRAECVDATALYAETLQSLSPKELEDGDRVLATIPHKPLQDRLAMQPTGWKILHGALLHQPWVLRLADRVLSVSIDPEVQARRVHGGALLDRYPRLDRDWVLGFGARLSADLELRFPSKTIAHLSICGDNPLGPGA